MKPNLAAELVLLAIDPAGQVQVDVDYGLAGAVLVELMLAERITLANRKIAVTDRAPVGDPLLDQALEQLAAGPAKRKPQDWIGHLSTDLRHRVLDQLVTAGVLRREHDRVLWVFPRTRYPSVTGAEPAVTAQVRARLRSAVDSASPVDARTAALCALVRALDMDERAVPDRPVGVVRLRLKAVADASWPADAVRQAMDEVQLAVMAATTAATTAITGGQQ